MAAKIIIKTPDEIEAMRRSGKLLSAAMKHIEKFIRAGARSKDVDREAETFIRDHGGVPSFKGYRGYPASLCMSFNEQVVHGIPGSRVIEEGDLIGVDCGVALDGWHADMARTFYVGDFPPGDIAKLIKITKSSLEKGIEQAVEGKRLGDISHAIQVEAELNGFSVVRALVGHGIGRSLHEDPQVPNFGPAKSGPELKENMTLAIEPMINQGVHGVKTLPDGWTIVTADAKLSCHFEHTVVVGKAAAETLTA